MAYSTFPGATRPPAVLLAVALVAATNGDALAQPAEGEPAAEESASVADLPIEMLTLAAIVLGGAEPVAIFRLPNGQPVTVRIGDAIGPRETGHLVSIVEDGVEIAYEDFGFGGEPQTLFIGLHRPQRLPLDTAGAQALTLILHGPLDEAPAGLQPLSSVTALPEPPVVESPPSWAYDRLGFDLCPAFEELAFRMRTAESDRERAELDALGFDSSWDPGRVRITRIDLVDASLVLEGLAQSTADAAELNLRLASPRMTAEPSFFGETELVRVEGETVGETPLLHFWIRGRANPPALDYPWEACANTALDNGITIRTIPTSDLVLTIGGSLRPLPEGTAELRLVEPGERIAHPAFARVPVDVGAAARWEDLGAVCRALSDGGFIPTAVRGLSWRASEDRTALTTEPGQQPGALRLQLEAIEVPFDSAGRPCPATLACPPDAECRCDESARTVLARGRVRQTVYFHDAAGNRLVSMAGTQYQAFSELCRYAPPCPSPYDACTITCESLAE